MKIAERISCVSWLYLPVAMLSLSCTEILVEPPLENTHDPLSSVFIPGAPGGLAASLKSDKAVQISWTGGSSFASTIRVERRTAEQPYMLLGTLPPDSTRFVDTSGVFLATTYGYRIGGMGSNGIISYSADLPFSMVFPSPVITTASDTARVFVQLKWNDVSGFAFGYVVERDDGTGVFAEIGRRPKGDESYVDFTADSDRVCQYRIRAITSLNVSDPSTSVKFQYRLETTQTSFSIPNAQIGAVSLDGKSLASLGLGASGEIRIFSLATGALLKDFLTGSPGISSVAFSPDGSLLAAGGVDSLRFLDVPSGIVRKSSPGYCEHVCFSQNGTKVAVSNLSTSTVQIWDPGTLSIVKELAGGDGVTISPDGSTIASLVPRSDGNGFAIEVRDVSSGALLGSNGSGYAEGNQLSFDLTGKVIVSGRFDHVFVTRVTDGTTLFQSQAGSYWSSVDVNAAGTYFIGADMGGPVAVWSLHSFEKVATVLLGQTYYYRTVRFLPDGGRFVVGTGTGVGMWSIRGRWITI